MSKKNYVVLISLAIVTIATVSIRGYYKSQYPYGRTHRCSKALYFALLSYSEGHNGDLPSSNDPSKLALTQLIGNGWVDQDSLDLIVGKAGDLDAAEQFYAQHGYIKPEHSSWYYVNGLNENDRGMALAWDKIPLDHNGRISESREIIMVGRAVDTIPNSEWPAFLKKQETLLAVKKAREAQDNDPQE
jgi:hypothetical protein